MADSPDRQERFARRRAGSRNDGAGESAFEERLRERLEAARIEYIEARTRLNALLQTLTVEVNSNLRDYAVRNVLREIKRSPAAFQALSEEQQTAFRQDLTVALELELPRITAAIRDNPEWFDSSTHMLNEKSAAWKTLKSIDPPINRVMRKYGFGAINTAGWQWLSEDIAKLAEKDYPFAKKLFIEAVRKVEYMETRVEEEATLGQVSRGIERLFPSERESGA